MPGDSMKEGTIIKRRPHHERIKADELASTQELNCDAGYVWKAKEKKKYDLKTSSRHSEEFPQPLWKTSDLQESCSQTGRQTDI